MNKLTRKLLISGIALTTALSLSACSLLPAVEVRRTAPILRQTEQEEFSLSYVTRGNMSLTKKISCTYVPIQKASIYFQLAGETVDEFFVNVGDFVHAGDLLGQLKLNGVNETIVSCESSIRKLKVRIAHTENNRALDIQKQHILYGADAEALEKALESVNAQYDASLQSLNDSLMLEELRLSSLLESRAMRQLFAPIDGTVTYVRKYQEGSVTSLNERAVTIADSTMSLFTCNTEYWEYFHVGDPVTITLRKIDYEAVVADETALGLPAEERIPGKKAKLYFTLVTPALDLEDNDKGSLTLELDSRTDVLRVSESAVSRANGQTIVYYQDEEGMKAYKNVELGLNAEKMYEVLSGLDEGEAVIVG